MYKSALGKSSSKKSPVTVVGWKILYIYIHMFLNLHTDRVWLFDGYTNLPARNDTLFSEWWGPKRSLISTTAGRSNTVTHISGWALVSSWAKAPVHPVKTNITAQCTRKLIYTKVGSCLTSKVTGCFEAREIKGCCYSLSCDFCNTMHGTHESKFDVLIVVESVLKKQKYPKLH